jgi:hypothetical protein
VGPRAQRGQVLATIWVRCGATLATHKVMLEPLRVATPVTSYLGLAAVGLGCGLLGAWLVIAPDAPPHRVVIEKSALLKPAIPEPTKPVAVVADDPPPPSAEELSLVFQLDGVSYVALADIAANGDVDQSVAEAPPHGKLRMVNDKDTGITAAFATVNPADVPADYRDWIEKRVAVDGDCLATVDGFAVISRLVGDPGYAGLEQRDWTAKSVLESGSAVFAARLDGCTQGLLARDAALSPIVTPTEIQNEALASEARTRLIDSDEGRTAAAAWTDAQAEGTWHEEVTFDTRVLRHPSTGETFVSVHAYFNEGCGGAQINLWGLFRSDNGELVTVELRELEGMTSLDLFDLEDDGRFELSGADWTDVTVKRASGAELERLDVPFFGCPC